MKRTAIFLGLALAAAGASALPDPCTLVKPSDLQALFPNGPSGPGTVEKHPEIGSVICSYQWGPGGNAYSGRFNFHVTVSEASKIFPGLDRETIKAGLLAETKKPGENGVAISGVGDVAIYKSNSPIRSNTTALVKGFVLLIDLDGPDGRAKKDQVISLLKTAAGRL